METQISLHFFCEKTCWKAAHAVAGKFKTEGSMHKLMIPALPQMNFRRCRYSAVSKIYRPPTSCRQAPAARVQLPGVQPNL